MRTTIMSFVRPRTHRLLRAKLKRDGRCWLFTGTRNAQGYGVVTLMKDRTRVGVLAHRLAWTLANGREPVGIICHRCHKPACCAPSHLYEGTPQSNAADMLRAGRHVAPLKGVKGARHPASKYTEGQRYQAIELRRQGTPFAEIVAIVGAPRWTISRWWNDRLGTR